jgi:hypothetical protein
MDFEQQLTVAMRATAERVSPPVELLVRGGAERGARMRRRRSRYAMAFGGAVGAAAVVAVALAAGLGRTAASTPPASQPTPTGSASVACGPPVRTDALPVWAQAGFSNPQAGGVPWVMGSQGDIVAVLFGHPLSAPEAKDHSNKILWVASSEQDPMQPLVVDAVKDGTTQVVRRTIANGPGPSYLDLPTPGCWHLDLSWDGGKQRDSLNLVYVKAAP